jgi:hypothetical protein
MRRLVAVAVLALGLFGLVGCGGSEAPKAAAPTKSVAGPNSTRTKPGATNDQPTVRVAVKDGKVVSGGGKHNIKLGSEVVLEIVSDKADQVHVHGYDKEAELTAGKPTRIEFTADIPGVFEVELHHAELQLCELQVQ